MRIATVVDEGPGDSAHVVDLGDGGALVVVVDPERDPRPHLTELDRPDTFVTRLQGGLGLHPPYFLELREVNREVVAVHGATPPPLRRLTAEQVRDERVDGDDLVGSAHTVGYEQLAGGMDAWQAAGQRVARTRLIDAPQANGRQVVDVRQRTEFAEGHAPGATHVELGTLHDHTDAVPDGPVVVHCSHSERAMSAASLLGRAGHHDVAVLAGSPRDLPELETGPGA